MRIGVVTSSYPRFEGDLAGCFVAEHVAWLRGQGHRVEVVCAGDDAAQGLPGVERVPVAPGLFYAGGAPEALASGHRLAATAFALRLAARLRRFRWDAMVGHWLLPAAIAALVKPRLPLAAIAHSGDVDLLCRTGTAPWVARLLRARDARLSFVAEHLRDRIAQASGPAVRNWLRGTSVVPMGIDIERLAGGDVPRRPGRIAFLGRLVDIKGIDVLLAAMPALVELGELVIAGDGPRRREVEDRAAQWGATFVGPVHGAARDELLRSAELVLIPSIADGQRREGAPVTAFEAMAAGAAVVASRTGGLAELPQAAVTWSEPGDVRALVTAVRRLQADRAARARQCAAASSWVRQRDWQAVGPRLMPPI